MNLHSSEKYSGIANDLLTELRNIRMYRPHYVKGKIEKLKEALMYEGISLIDIGGSEIEVRGILKDSYANEIQELIKCLLEKIEFLKTRGFDPLRRDFSSSGFSLEDFQLSEKQRRLLSVLLEKD
ncbi:MAG: hypothetical protein HZC04_01615 [Candidatus Lloydbacteria bacterium]|nr:hypothetical protein [Candidatus Lloydbacteria bacterium]